MNILILGGEGMAGWMIGQYLSKKYSVCSITRKELDIEKSLQLPEGFDFIINCIGVLLKDANTNPARTVYVNSYFPKFLEQFYKHTQTKIIHISTDCVFSGSRGFYIENDVPDETNLYGRSKALGEINNDKDLTLRVSIIGPEIKSEEKRSGLLNWILTSKETTLDGWANVMWNGITTLQLAKCIEKYINNPTISGIHHPSGSFISKYELLNKINTIYSLNKNINETRKLITVDKTLINTKKYFMDIPTYDQQLEELKSFIY